MSKANNKFNIDKVPRDLDEAVEMIIETLGHSDQKTICHDKYIAAKAHHGLGRFIRNSWSLWDRHTHLCNWFRANLEIGHADDISTIIIEAVRAKLSGLEYDPTSTVQRFHDHWARFGCDNYGNPLRTE